MGRYKQTLIGIKNAIEDPETTKKLLRWIVKQTSPYMGWMLLIFSINIISICISYGSTIVGKYVVDDATNGVIDLHNMLMMGSMTCLSILVGIGSKISSAYISERFSFGVRVKMFANVQQSDWKEITKIHSGDILTRLTSDISTVTSGLIDIVPTIILVIIQLFLAFGILYHYDHVMALAALIIAPIGAFLALLFRRQYSKYQKLLKESESQYRSFMQDCVSNLVVMKTFEQEESNNKQLEMIRKDRIGVILKSSQLSAFISAMFSIVYNLGYVIAFCWGAYRISQNQITYGTMTIFISFVSRIQGTISSLASMVPEMYNVMVSANRIHEITELDKEVYNYPENYPEKVGAEIDHVDFAYDEELILKDVDLKVKPGEKVAIVGESGAGKTTLIRMLLALTHPNKGSITYLDENGEPEPACPDSRRFISYVPQGNTLISGTIKDNMLIGKEGATDDEIWEALRLAGAEKFMRKLPDGLDTVLAENAGGISEGQAQRVAIARALIGGKPVMILDEATSALDENTEALVLKNIADNYKNITCFVITHRRSMLQYCDRVLEIKDDGTTRIRGIRESMEV